MSEAAWRYHNKIESVRSEVARQIERRVVELYKEGKSSIEIFETTHREFSRYKFDIHKCGCGAVRVFVHAYNETPIRYISSRPCANCD